MRRHLLLLAVGAVLVGTPAAPAQAVKAPGSYIPARALAYAEVRQPGRLAQEIRSLFQGSVLANVPDSLARLRGTDGADRARFQEAEFIGMLGVMLSQEVAAEVGRLHGVAIALTGIDKRGNPEYLAVVQPGTSNAPAFFMRAAMVMGRTSPLKRVEGVTIYQTRTLRYDPRQRGLREEPGTALARMPGLLFCGSPAAVEEAVKLAKGKGEGEALAQSREFQTALAEAPKEPGIFAYLNLPGFLKLVEEHAKERPAEVAPLKAVLKLINPKAFRAVTYSLTLNKGTLLLQKAALLDPKEKSPIIALLPTTPVNTELLNYAPKDAILLGALSNGGGGERWARLLKVADELARLGGQENGLPSEHVKQLEGRLGIDLGKDVFARVANVGFAVGNPFKAPVKKTVEKVGDTTITSVGPEVPVVVLVQATDEAAAKKFVKDVVPQVVGLLAGKEGVKPETKEVDGRRLHTISLGRHRAVHYGRHGKVLVLGPYAAPVARALADGAGKKGWVSDEKSAALLREPKDPYGVLVVKPGTMLMGLAFTYMGDESRTAPALREKSAPAPVKRQAQEARGDKRPAAARGDKRPAAARGNQGEAQIMKELERVLAGEQPLVVSLTNTPERSMAELRWGGLKPLVARLTNFAVEQYYRSRPRAEGRSGKATAPAVKPR